MSNSVEIKIKARTEGREAVEELGKRIGEMKEELAALSKTAGNAENYRNLSARCLELSQSMDKAAGDASGMALKIKTAMTTLDVRPLSEVKSEIAKLTEAHTLLKTSGNLSFTEMQKATRNYQEKVVALRGEYNGIETSLSTIKTGFITMAGAAYTAWRAVGSYLEFSKEMANISTIVDVTREEFAGFTREIEDLSGKFPQSAKEFASAAYDVLSSGVKIEETVKVLEQSSKAAAAGVTDVKTAAAAGVGVLNAYGMGIDKLNEIYDIMFQTVKDGVTTFPELAQHIGEVLPTAKAAGVEFGDVAGAIAAMTKAGIRTPLAATALKGALNAMAAPAPEAKKQFEALGITWQGFIPTLETIRQKSLSLDQLRMLIPDVEARTAVLSLTQNMEGLKTTLAGIDTAAGATDAAWAKIKDTPAYQIDLFKREVENLAKSMGESMVPALLGGIDALKGLSEWYRNAGDATQLLISGMGLAAGGFAAWKLALSPMVDGIMALRGQMALAATTAPVLTAALSTLAKGAVILWGVAETYEAIKAFMEMRAASEALEAAQARLSKQTSETQERFRGFKDIEIPDNIYEKPIEELETLAEGLSKARAYNQALIASLSVKAEQKTFFGELTGEAKAAALEMETVASRQKEVNAAILLAKAAIQEKRGATEAETVKEIDAVALYRQAIEAGTLAISDQIALIAKNGGMATGYYADMAKAELLVHQKKLADMETEAKQSADLLKQQVFEVELAEAQGVKSKEKASSEKREIETKANAASIALLKDRLSAVEKIANAEAALQGEASKETLREKERLEKDLAAAQDAGSRLRIETAAAETEKKVSLAESEAKARVTASKDVEKAVKNETAVVKENTQAIEENASAAESSIEPKRETIRISVSTKAAYDDEGKSLSQLSRLLFAYQGMAGAGPFMPKYEREIASLQAMVTEYESLAEEARRYGLILDRNNMPLDDARKKVEALRSAFKELSDQMAQVSSDTDQAVREMNRRTMTEAESHKDREREYQETMAQAEKLSSQKNYEAAATAYLQAKELAEGLAEEVKDVSGQTILTLSETTKSASALMKEASDKAVEALAAQKEALTDLQKVGAFREPSLRGYATGGKLPGFGTEDTVPALLTPGERITNARSVRIWDSLYPGLMDAINATRTSHDTSRILAAFGTPLRFNTGGIVPDYRFSIPSLPSQPAAASSGRMVEVRFVVDSGERGSVMADEPSTELLLNQLKKARMVS